MWECVCVFGVRVCGTSCCNKRQTALDLLATVKLSHSLPHSLSSTISFSLSLYHYLSLCIYVRMYLVTGIALPSAQCISLSLWCSRRVFATKNGNERWFFQAQNENQLTAHGFSHLPSLSLSLCLLTALSDWHQLTAAPRLLTWLLAHLAVSPGV